MAFKLVILWEVLQRAIVFGCFALFVCLSFFVLRALYNVYLHPLASFPGPKSAAASNIPYVRAQVGGKLPQWISALHSAYDSPIVRIAPTELSFISADAWKDIYSYRPGHAVFERDELTYGKAANGVHTLLTAQKGDHARFRRVLDHAFSDRASRDQEPIVVAHVDTLIRTLHEQVRGQYLGKVDVVKWYHWMSFDIIGDLSFGQSFDCLKTQRYHPWVEMVFGNLKGIAVIGACNRIAIVRRLLPYFIPERLVQMKQDHWAATVQTVERRLELDTDRPDFMTPIIKHNNEGKGGLTRPEIIANMSLLIIAGSDSIATSLGGATYYLLQNPEVMKRLSAEVESTYTSEEQITPQSVCELPYLLACLAETRRIYPTALTGQPMVVPPAGDTICGRWVPGGTVVTINMLAAYRSPTNFADPNSYHPERWLGDPRYASDNRNVFQPFSVGPRNCIGKNLGNLETRLALARMIWNFEIKLSANTDSAWDDQLVFLSWQKKPLIVELKAKERASMKS